MVYLPESYTGARVQHFAYDSDWLLYMLCSEELGLSRRGNHSVTCAYRGEPDRFTRCVAVGSALSLGRVLSSQHPTTSGKPGPSLCP
jgi:hypothetical protein